MIIELYQLEQNMENNVESPTNVLSRFEGAIYVYPVVDHRHVARLCGAFARR
jgi:hypothetical protein